MKSKKRGTGVLKVRRGSLVAVVFLLVAWGGYMSFSSTAMVADTGTAVETRATRPMSREPGSSSDFTDGSPPGFVTRAWRSVTGTNGTTGDWI